MSHASQGEEGARGSAAAAAAGSPVASVAHRGKRHASAGGVLHSDGSHSSPVCLSSGGDCSGDSGSDGSQHASGERRRGGKRKRKRSFRCTGKCFALTYPKCETERADFDAAFHARFGPFTDYGSAREAHADGTHHMHVFVAFGRRRDLRSSRYFDLAVGGRSYHSNTQKCKSAAAWKQYISKGEDFHVSSAESGAAYNPLGEELGKRKSMYADYQWSRDFAVSRSMRDVEYPVELACDGITYQLCAPDPACKRRSWWIVAPPNAGKTRWINRVFAGRRIWCPRTGKYPFEGYDDQDIIIYDDREGVSFAELASVLNTWDIIQPIAGEIRYVTKNWKIGHTRSVIVLSNHTIEESMPDDIQRMRKRFIQIVNPTLLQPDELSSPDPSPQPALSNPDYQAFAS